jgi:UDP-glucuronate 4-epimerase
MKTLVTGAAGFIGAATARRLLEQGDEVLGLDNLNDYYAVSLKRDRLALLEPQRQFRFTETDLADRSAMQALFAAERFDRVVHLGAQAGVRHSLKAPHAYVESNIVGTLNVLEGCRHHGVGHLVSASHPVSLYAATKRANELMAHSYSSLFGLPTTGLRFFTVYGPWGRPDMALFLFARAIVDGKPIEIFNHGHHKRDFTYIDDIVEGVVRVLDHVPAPDPAWDSARADPGRSAAPYRLYNIGSNRPIDLLRYVELLEECLGKRVEKIMRPMQPGDVADTFADVSELIEDVDYKPGTPVEDGVRRFVEWFRDYYAVR